MSDIEIKLEQVSNMVQTHHAKINNIEKTLGQTPDPATLRHMEHVIKELPDTDDGNGVMATHPALVANTDERAAAQGTLDSATQATIDLVAQRAAAASA